MSFAKSHCLRPQDVQMLMNMYCNDHMNHNDGTCCSKPEVTTKLQIIVAAFFLVW